MIQTFSTLQMIHSTKTSINEWLGNVFKYCASNKLLINFNTKIRRNLALRWQNVIFKYLGTFFDEHLKWYAIERLKRTNCKLSIKWESATIRNKEKFIRYDQQAKKQCSTTPRGRATPQRAARMSRTAIGDDRRPTRASLTSPKLHLAT